MTSSRSGSLIVSTFEFDTSIVFTDPSDPLVCVVVGGNDRVGDVRHDMWNVRLSGAFEPIS